MRTMKNDKEGVTYSRWDPTYPLDMRGRTHPILVWQYSDAPGEIRELASQGGDEDWVALVPPEVNADIITWAAEGKDDAFGCCSVEYVKLDDGGTLIVGTHA